MAASEESADCRRRNAAPTLEIMQLWSAKLIGALAICAAMPASVSCAGPARDQEASPPASAATSGVSAHSRLVGPDGFAAAIQEPDRITINVHVPFEGDIPGTDVSIPFDQIASQTSKLPADRSAPLAIYCRSGPMSTTAAAELAKLGFRDVVELRGGMRAWRESGRPLE